MYSIHTRDDLEKLKKLQETKSSLKAERLKEKLGKQDFHYDLEEGFEPVTTKQAESNEKSIQAIENQTRAIEHNNNTLQNSIKERIKQYNEITNHHAELRNQLLTSLVNSNQVDSSIVKTVSNLLNDKNKIQFSLEPIESYPNSFTINPHNPQQVLIKGSTMTFENGNSYNLNDPDLQYFITNTQFDKQIKNWDSVYNFLNDMKYDLNYGDKKSIRYQFIKELYSRYQLQGYTQGFAQGYTQAHDSQGQSQGFTGSGLNGESYRETSRSSTRSSTQQYIFLPSDPDELVDQLKLLYFEKVGGNDNPQLNEQIIAIVDKLLEYECISPSQHQNIRSSTSSQLLKGSVCGLKILYFGLDSLQILYLLPFLSSNLFIKR